MSSRLAWAKLRPILKIKIRLGKDSVVEHLPKMYEVLGSNSNGSKKKEKEDEEEEE